MTTPSALPPVDTTPANPVVEVVLDIECDLPRPLDLLALEEGANVVFKADYPGVTKKLLLEQQMTAEIRPDQPVQPTMSPPRSSVHAIRYMRADPASIVQIRSTGYSFNCLPPYRSLDDHLPETHRTWDAFCALTEPRAVRQIAIRYVNRLVLPFEQQEQRLDLDSYLALGPRLPDEHRLLFTGFFHRHEVVEAETGNMATITLTTQPPGQAGQLSVILDLAARNNLLPIPPADWERINEVINSLRALNNHIFQRSLTPLCRARYTSLR